MLSAPQSHPCGQSGRLAGVICHSSPSAPISNRATMLPRARISRRALSNVSRIPGSASTAAWSPARVSSARHTGSMPGSAGLKRGGAVSWSAIRTLNPRPHTAAIECPAEGQQPGPTIRNGVSRAAAPACALPLRHAASPRRTETARPLQETRQSAMPSVISLPGVVDSPTRRYPRGRGRTVPGRLPDHALVGHQEPVRGPGSRRSPGIRLPVCPTRAIGTIGPRSSTSGAVKVHDVERCRTGHRPTRRRPRRSCPLAVRSR